jgi:hypothetical protein
MTLTHTDTDTDTDIDTDTDADNDADANNDRDTDTDTDINTDTDTDIMTVTILYYVIHRLAQQGSMKKKLSVESAYKDKNMPHNLINYLIKLLQTKKLQNDEKDR